MFCALFDSSAPQFTLLLVRKLTRTLHRYDSQLFLTALPQYPVYVSPNGSVMLLYVGKPNTRMTFGVYVKDRGFSSNGGCC